MKTSVKRTELDNGGFFESATLTIQGKDFTSGGAAVWKDKDGVQHCNGYVQVINYFESESNPKKITRTIYRITDFEGKVIGNAVVGKFWYSKSKSRGLVHCRCMVYATINGVKMHGVWAYQDQDLVKLHEDVEQSIWISTLIPNTFSFYCKESDYYRKHISKAKRIIMEELPGIKLYVLRVVDRDHVTGKYISYWSITEPTTGAALAKDSNKKRVIETAKRYIKEHNITVERFKEKVNSLPNVLTRPTEGELLVKSA